MFQRYDKKDKKVYLFLKSIVMFGIIISGLLSIKITNSSLEIITETDKVKLSIGLILILIIVTLVFIKKIAFIIKIKSLGFLVVALLLFTLKAVIDTLIVTFLLISIPLIFDDLFVKTYFNYLNMSKYFNDYKYIKGALNEWN